MAHKSSFLKWGEGNNYDGPCRCYHEGKERKGSYRVFVNNEKRSPNNEDGEEGKRHDNGCFAEGWHCIEKEEKEQNP